MATLPWLKVYVAETLSDANFQSWTMEERGAWFSLILVNWREGSIPENLDALARLLHVDGNRMRSLWQAIGDRFIPHPDLPGRLTSRRLEQEREEAIAQLAKRSEAGKAGATSRWAKGKVPDGNRMRPHSVGIAEPVRIDSAPAQPSPDQPQPQPQPASHSAAVAALPGWLAGVAERLGLELGRTLAVGADAAAVVQAFTARREELIASGVEDPDGHLLADCIAIARRSRAGVPGTLAFFVGWFTNAASSRRAP